MSTEDNQNSSSADIRQSQTKEVESEQSASNENSFEVTQSASFEKESNLKKEVSECEDMEISDQELYNEVLEKLDIVPRQTNQEIQERSMQERRLETNLSKNDKLLKSQTQNQIEKMLVQDFSKIQKLAQAGLINSVQGQNLKKEVLKKAFDKIVQTEMVKRLSPALKPADIERQSIKSTDKTKALEEFSKENPDFFNSNGRKEVLDFLKSDEIFVGKDELNRISGLVRNIEKAAIEKYLNTIAYEKTLKESNDAAKQRLTANAQKSGVGDKNFSRGFTREQIGKMSSAEFTKYESIIMQQLKKGLIK